MSILLLITATPSTKCAAPCSMISWPGVIHLMQGMNFVTLVIVMMLRIWDQCSLQDQHHAPVTRCTISGMVATANARLLEPVQKALRLLLLHCRHREAHLEQQQTPKQRQKKMRIQRWRMARSRLPRKQKVR